MKAARVVKYGDAVEGIELREVPEPAAPKSGEALILHFTPTSCSWLNLVERLFAEITRQRIRRGIFHDVAELKAAINEWIEHRNQDPKPFIWTATAKTILVKHRRAKKVLAKAGRK
jgi:transposase